ncbi:MAG: acetyl-CoA carboxylase biotin carboxylase subunit [Deltaproteobacteria bacterium]|nr:acetyl-CoA carboxylase biotin carboxylase subunit [Deltaproteobacteria bacterium]
MKRVLIANRGEIAVRVGRACRAMGLETVAVCSEADAGALHVREADQAVCVGPAAAIESYLLPDAILAAARDTGADAIHPGYGFLSENAGFARAVLDAGLLWVGPPPDAIAAMGSKIESRARMAAAGVPVVPGVDALPDDPDARAEAAAQLGYPVLVKASAGGGGKGMRGVAGPEELEAAVAGARREAGAAFADATVYLEKLLLRPRHVEIQVLADAHGAVLHLLERECSIQRRHQKVIEECPSPALDPALRERMGQAAVAAARAVGYVGAGTVEFMLDERGSFYFLEMNTRLQVEHPVTEEVVGIDLVAAQLRVAMGQPLPWTQQDIAPRGHAIEVRLYAEDPAREFLPATGTLLRYRPPTGPGLRHDGGVAEGDVVSPHYDPMLAKLIAVGETRDAARGRMLDALARFEVHGVTTNLGFLHALVAHPAFAAGDTHTGFIDEHFPEASRTAEAPDQDALIAIAVAELFGGGSARATTAGGGRGDTASPWHTLGAWRGTP